MKLRYALALGAFATGVTAPACLSIQPAGAVANCGGQSAAPQPVPYTCNLPGIDITFQGVTRHFSAVVNADGTHVTVQYLMTGGVLPVAVPIRIVHHEGISGAGGSENESQGVIPAGQTTATLTDSAPCRDGQLDVKAVFIANGQSNGRVGGPWIQNGTDCGATPTTVPQSSTTLAPTTSSTAPPPTTTLAATTTVEVSTAPTPPSGGGGADSKQLPVTGKNTDTVQSIAIFILAIGVLAMLLAVRRDDR